MKDIKKFGQLNERVSSKRIEKFLDELTTLSNKYDLYIESTDTIYLTDYNESGLGDIQYDIDEEKYIFQR